MAHLKLNCPTCCKPLVYVPLDGLTLHYRCCEHGLLIFKPLVEIGFDDQLPTFPQRDNSRIHAHDAA